MGSYSHPLPWSISNATSVLLGEVQVRLQSKFPIAAILNGGGQLADVEMRDTKGSDYKGFVSWAGAEHIISIPSSSTGLRQR